MTLEFTRPPIGEHVTLNALIYGGPKAGKSALAGTAPPGVLFWNADLPNATRYVHASNPNGSILELKMPAYDEQALQHGITPTLTLMNEVEIALANPDQQLCRSFVLDPVGELHRRLREELSRRAIRPTQSVYGDVAAHIERFCRALCTNPSINVVIVCHETTMKDESTGEILRIPFTGTQQGSPSQSQTLMGMVDIVGYRGVATDQEGRHYRTQLYAGRGRQAGERYSGCLGSVREDGIADWIKTIEAYERKLVSTSKQADKPKSDLPTEGERPNSTPSSEGARPPQGDAPPAQQSEVARSAPSPDRKPPAARKPKEPAK